VRMITGEFADCTDVDDVANVGAGVFGIPATVGSTEDAGARDGDETTT